MADPRRSYKISNGSLTPLSMRVMSTPGIVQQTASINPPLNYQGISYASQGFDPRNTRAYVLPPLATPIIMRGTPITPQTH